jgi:hypothetical protein
MTSRHQARLAFRPTPVTARDELCHAQEENSKKLPRFTVGPENGLEGNSRGQTVHRRDCTAATRAADRRDGMIDW